ncbi:MAG TPA: hypothetical protein ENG68_02565 [bacterium]|nr:hypothetical protein [bacterium]
MLWRTILHRKLIKTYCLSQNQNYITYINNSIIVHIC